jgi:hypothetical protein
MTIITSTAGLNDLMALAREIEATERLPRREALQLAIREYNECLILVESDQRFVPAGWSLAPHVNLSLPPMVWDGADPLMAVGQ